MKKCEVCRRPCQPQFSLCYKCAKKKKRNTARATDRKYAAARRERRPGRLGRKCALKAAAVDAILAATDPRNTR